MHGGGGGGGGGGEQLTARSFRTAAFFALRLRRADCAHLYAHLEMCLQTETDNLCKQPGAHIWTEKMARRTAGGCAVLIRCDALWIISRYSVSLAAALAKTRSAHFLAR